MGVYKDADEVYQFVGGMFERAITDPVIGQKFADAGVNLHVIHTEPEAIFIVDVVGRKLLCGDDAVQFRRRNFKTPFATFVAKADVGHRFWSGGGYAYAAVAVAKGEVKAKGPYQKILKLLPLVKDLFPMYRELLLKAGRHDLVGAG